MVIDTSAAMAILKTEPDAQRYADAIDVAETRLISAALVLETGIAAESRREGGKKLDGLLFRARVQIVPFDAEQAELAREAFRRFGKGRHKGRPEFRRLLRLCARAVLGRAAIVQGRRFLGDGCRGGSARHVGRKLRRARDPPGLWSQRGCQLAAVTAAVPHRTVAAGRQLQTSRRGRDRKPRHPAARPRLAGLYRAVLDRLVAALHQVHRGEGPPDKGRPGGSHPR